MKVPEAHAMARGALCSLPDRLQHVTSVARSSVWVAQRLELDPEVLVSSAWLHDIGYVPSISRTGFHSLDGARFLRREGFPANVVNLVAYHSHAVVEAELRDLRGQLESEFPYDPSLPHDLLCYCDMTTGPSGVRVTVEQRLREIRARYGPDDVVTRFIGLAEKDIVETVERVENRLSVAAQSK